MTGNLDPRRHRRTMRAHDDRDQRRGIFRRLTLVGPRGTFLRRAGIDVRLVGVYLHRIDAPDPGIDLHDHPWSFASLVLRGGYLEEHAETREAPSLAWIAEQVNAPASCRSGVLRSWKAGSFHRIRLHEAHRIVDVKPNTITLVLRGPKVRSWGFYLPLGFVDQRDYDYAARRPVAEARR